MQERSKNIFRNVEASVFFCSTYSFKHSFKAEISKSKITPKMWQMIHEVCGEEWQIDGFCLTAPPPTSALMSNMKTIYFVKLRQDG